MAPTDDVRVRSYVYDSRDRPDYVEAVLERLADHDAVEIVDVGADQKPNGRVRDAMFTVKGAVRIGSVPEELFDAEGEPDFSAGALITEAPTGRRSLHIGRDALDALGKTR